MAGWLFMARFGAALAQPFVLLQPVLLPPPQPPEFVHWLLSRLRTAASSKLPSGLCAAKLAPSMSTLPEESMTTSEGRARAARAMTAEVAAPTASAAVPNSPRRLTSGLVLSMLSFDIGRP